MRRNACLAPNTAEPPLTAKSDSGLNAAVTIAPFTNSECSGREPGYTIIGSRFVVIARVYINGPIRMTKIADLS